MTAYAESGYLTGNTAGTQVSSTYEGRMIILLESGMTHPSHTDGFVDKGDPIVYGDIVGVAMMSAAAGTDYITVDTEGIWNLTVTGTHSDGTADGAGSAVAIGDDLYINISDGTITKEKDPSTHRYFGTALGAVAASTAVVMAVKVHGTTNVLTKINVGAFGAPHELDVDAYGTGGQNGVAWLNTFLSSSTVIESDEQLMGIYIRVNNSTATDAGTINCAHFKNVQDAANTTQLAQSVAIKADTDLRGAGAIWQVGMEVMCEGACTASDHRTGLRFISRDTAGTLESLFALEIATTFGCAVDTLTAASYAIPVDVAGTLHYIQLYST